jgi:hypothetical protein
LVTHNYNPGKPNTVEVIFNAWRAQNWTRVAWFTPTGAAQGRNEPDFSPWTESPYERAPNYDFAITVFCK